MTNHQHNLIVVLMIPDLVDIGSPSPWPVLPPGIHDAEFAEIAAKFATTPHRVWLNAGAVAAAIALKAAGCLTLYLNGSFTTGKPVPGDYDACWDPAHVDPNKLDPVLLDFANQRAAQKRKYRGELFIHSQIAVGQITFLQYFQKDKFSARRKGIIKISLANLP